MRTTLNLIQVEEMYAAPTSQTNKIPTLPPRGIISPSKNLKEIAPIPNPPVQKTGKMNL